MRLDRFTVFQLRLVSELSACFIVRLAQAELCRMTDNVSHSSRFHSSIVHFNDHRCSLSLLLALLAPLVYVLGCVTILYYFNGCEKFEIFDMIYSRIMLHNLHST